jgi:hypothetical protein
MHYISIKYRRFGQRLAGALSVRIEGEASPNVNQIRCIRLEKRAAW